MGTEFLTAVGASKTQIGATSLLHLAVTFKFVWSPALDLFGRRRTWLWALELLLGWACWWWRPGAVAQPDRLLDRRLGAGGGARDPRHRLRRVLPAGPGSRGQALYSGTRLGAYRLAMIVGSSVLVYLAGKTSWLLGFGAAGS